MDISGRAVADSIVGRSGGAKHGAIVERANAASSAIGKVPIAPTSRPVLLVEDDEILWRFLVALLELERFEVVRARSGDEALELLGRLDPAVLILDANISSPSSTEFLRRLRRAAGASRPAILCLIMPGQSGLRKINRALGVDEYIAEPFEPAAMVRAVRTLAEKRSAA